MSGIPEKGEAVMNHTMVSRINPWIVAALAIVLILLVAAALTLVVEPGLLHAIRTALQGAQQVSDPCPGSVGSSC
jgi:hypothetical protein